MIIFNVLKKDHALVKKILNTLEKTDEKQTAKREKLFKKFKAEMVAHSRAEEKTVYANIIHEKATRSIAFEAKEEHALVDGLIAELSNLAASEETWTAKMTVMKELIEHHIEEEEDDMFKKMRKACSAAELKEMGEAMEAMKKKILKQPQTSKAPKEPSISNYQALDQPETSAAV